MLKSLKSTLNIAFLVVLILPLTTATIFSIDYFSLKIRQDALARISSDLDLVSLLLDRETAETRFLAQSYTQMVNWAVFLNLGLTSKLNDKLLGEAVSHRLDEIMVVSQDRNVLASSLSIQGPREYMVPGDFADQAFAGKVLSGLELIANSNVRPDGRPILSVTAAAPLYDSNRENVIGALIIRRFLRDGYLQRILPAGTVPDTCFFARDGMISTNTGDSASPELSSLDPAIVREVFDKGRTFEEAILKPSGHLAEYRPLLGLDGKPIGALMVRKGADDYVRTQRKAIIFLSSVALVGVLLTLAVRAWIKHSIFIPISTLSEATKRLAAGDYSRQIPVRTVDEIGELSKSFNIMACRLEKRTQELEEMNLLLTREIFERKRSENELSESEKQLRLLSSQLITAQEEERKRIAREVHDSIASSLVAIKVCLENTVHRLTQEMPVTESIATSISITQDAIDESRRIISDLRPPLLDDLGVLATIGWFSRQYQSIHPDIFIEKQLEIQETEIPEVLKIAIFRIIQEALNNVAKYSRAEMVNLCLQKTENGIVLMVEDFGVGFDVSILMSRDSKTTGWGIAGMKERTELTGGVFDIQSVPGEGTTVRCWWANKDKP